MSPEEIEKTVVEKIREMGRTDKASAGKTYRCPYERVSGSADGNDVKAAILSHLP